MVQTLIEAIVLGVRLRLHDSSSGLIVVRVEEADGTSSLKTWRFASGDRAGAGSRLRDEAVSLYGAACARLRKAAANALGRIKKLHSSALPEEAMDGARSAAAQALQIYVRRGSAFAAHCAEIERQLVDAGLRPYAQPTPAWVKAVLKQASMRLP